MTAIEALIPLAAILAVFVGMPWLLLHYLTKWKQAKSITMEDENLLDELHDVARRLEDRMTTIERIIAADRDMPELPRGSARLDSPRPPIGDATVTEFRSPIARKEI